MGGGTNKRPGAGETPQKGTLCRPRTVSLLSQVWHHNAHTWVMATSPLVDLKPQPCHTDPTGGRDNNWAHTCLALRKVWERGGRAVHFAINSGAETERAVLQLRTGTPPKPLVGNLGDAVLPTATRMAFNFFLGHPTWRLRDLYADAAHVASDLRDADNTRYAAALVGGGGLFYPSNGHSMQGVSGWQWRVATPDLDRLKVPIFLFGVGWNAFRNQSFADSPAHAHASPNQLNRRVPQQQLTLWPKPGFALAFHRSLAALVRKQNAIIGLRESYSLLQVRRMTSNPERLIYQPCATTLVGAMQPSLASRTLLDPESKVLAINLASDHPELRAGTKEEQVLLAQQLLRFAFGAHRLGWTIHMVQQSGLDNRQLNEQMKATRSLAVPHVLVAPKTVADVFEYYGRNVTVAASMRGHGVMIPFGLHVATISLVTHEKVQSFLSDIGHPEWGVEATIGARADRGAGLARELLGVLSNIDRNRARVHSEIKAAQMRLMAVTAHNMQEFGQMVASYAAQDESPTKGNTSGSKPNVGTQSEVRCASCERDRGSGLNATVLPTTGWREACTLEQLRAAAFLVKHQALNTPYPQIDTQLLDASLEQTGKTLRQLLHSRGSLCSDNVPCSVDIVDNSSLSVCLPVLSKPSSDPKMCELTPSALLGEGFHMRKACSQGTRTRRCFKFNPGAIREWIAAMRLKVHAPGSVSILPPDNLDRCAVVLSGHVLRCSSQQWAAVIDSPFYDAIFRTNVYPVAHPDCPVSTKLAEVKGGGEIAGRRTDIGYSGCRAAAQPGVCEPRFCLNGSKVTEWSMSVRQNPTLGLGLGHSGGLLVDAALAHCGEVHVFGAGLFSRGPGFDAVVQHWYDSDFSVDGCSEQCSLDGFGEGDRISFFSRFQSSLCRPSRACQAPQAKAKLLPKSEIQGDFFYLSELRFPLYHALGLVNWIWW